MLTIQEEKFAPFFADGMRDGLFERHHRELALNQDKIKMDLDAERYQKLEDLGMLFVLTVRQDQKLMGYLVAFLQAHPHYKSAGTMALTDMYWVSPDVRNGVGALLFIKFEKLMRERGIVQIMTGCKRHQDHTKLLELLGWTNSDLTFLKVLI